jgi:hypothetical protein
MKIERPNKSRHPELVSGSIAPNAMSAWDAGWMLKQVQHDDKRYEK